MNARRFAVQVIREVFDIAIVIAATVVIFVCLALLVEAVKAAPLRCKWIDGSEVDCLIDQKTQPLNTVRVLEAPLFADSFE